MTTRETTGLFARSGDTPVALVSTSPEREDTILVRDPFVD